MAELIELGTYGIKQLLLISFDMKLLIWLYLIKITYRDTYSSSFE